MTAELTLAEAAARFTESVKEASRPLPLAELNRFVRWYGAERPLSQLRGHEISLYAEVLGPATPDSSRRADYIRAFLTYLKKAELVGASLAPHLRLRKTGKLSGLVGGQREPGMVELTQAGIDALKTELESLIGQRMAVREDIRKAMLDKDFRENSPLDAAKDRQGHIEARVREIEAMLKRAVVVDNAATTGRVRVGTAVRVKNLGSGTETRYVIVGPTEANAADGKISSVSPVGKALLNRTPGEEVEVSVPNGLMRLKVEAIEG
jgi:transcription elongation factor GreA